MLIFTNLCRVVDGRSVEEPWRTLLGMNTLCFVSSCADLCNLTFANTTVLVNATWLTDNNLTCSAASVVSIPVQSPSEQYWE